VAISAGSALLSEGAEVVVTAANSPDAGGLGEPDGQATRRDGLVPAGSAATPARSFSNRRRACS
jgi:hypothetical protein